MNNPYFSLLRTSWKYARSEKKRFVLIYSFFIMANIIVGTAPILYGWFVNELQLKGTNILKTGWIYVAVFLAFKLLEWAFHGPGRILERRLAFSLSRNFMDELYHKVLHLPMQWHQDNHSGSTINKLRKAHEALREFFQHGFIFFYTFGKFVFSFAAMIYFSPLFGAIGVVLGIFTVYIIRKFDKPFIATLKEVNAREHEVSSNLFDSLSNIVTVITLRLEKRIHSGYLQKLAAVYPPFRKNVSINEWKWFTAQMMIGVIYSVTIVGYLYQHWQPGQVFLIGGLVVLLGYVNQFTSVFNDVASHYTQIMRYHAEVENVRDIENAYDQSRTSVANGTMSDWNNLEITNLSFHRGRELSLPRPSGISDLSMKISKGKRIALIGESGSGKSTLLALLRGLYAPQTGSHVVVDGTDKINFESISDTVTLFPQEPEIFENTVLYNITMGLSFSEQDVHEACKRAQFCSVLATLPQGLNTSIMEKGVNLSGGQKQRLALARGILAARQSEIVLLDEPTSSIDPRTEKMLYESLFDVFADKAVISSLHRLHLLPMFDYVYILKDGRVVDQGTPKELEFSTAFKAITTGEHIKGSQRESVNGREVMIA